MGRTSGQQIKQDNPASARRDSHQVSTEAESVNSYRPFIWRTPFPLHADWTGLSRSLPVLGRVLEGLRTDEANSSLSGHLPVSDITFPELCGSHQS